MYITKLLFYILTLDGVDIISAEKVVLTAKTSEINEKIRKFTKLWSTNLCTSNIFCNFAADFKKIGTMDRSFVYGMFVDGNNFTDRVKETKRLKMDFEHGMNVILISPRRMGKTSLVKHVQGLIDEELVKVV